MDAKFLRLTQNNNAHKWGVSYERTSKNMGGLQASFYPFGLAFRSSGNSEDRRAFSGAAQKRSGAGRGNRTLMAIPALNDFIKHSKST
jgi:hypothetical protein